MWGGNEGDTTKGKSVGETAIVEYRVSEFLMNCRRGAARGDGEYPLPERLQEMTMRSKREKGKPPNLFVTHPGAQGYGLEGVQGNANR